MFPKQVLAKVLIALYIIKQKEREKFLDAKISKRSYTYKGDISTYYVEILNSFNPELELKTESAIKNKLINLFTELKGFNFVTSLVLKYKK